MYIVPLFFRGLASAAMIPREGSDVTEAEIEAAAKAMDPGAFHEPLVGGEEFQYRRRSEARIHARRVIEAVEQARWQPIETAPRDGTRFLAADETGEQGIVSRHDPGGEQRNPKHHYECWVTDFNSPRGNSPTHWQPLQAPPAEPRFDFGKQCCFCGANNENGTIGYAGERTCSNCGKGGFGEPDEPVMAYKGNLPKAPPEPERG